MLVRERLIADPLRALHAEWQQRVIPVIEPIAGALPPATPTIDGRERHGDDFRWLHGEFTMVARAEVGATW